MEWAATSIRAASTASCVAIADAVGGLTLGWGDDLRPGRRVILVARRVFPEPSFDVVELLGKHHKLYVDRHEHDWGAGVAERLAAALVRVQGPQQSSDGDLVRSRPLRRARKAARNGERARAR